MLWLNLWISFLTILTMHFGFESAKNPTWSNGVMLTMTATNLISALKVVYSA